MDGWTVEDGQWMFLACFGGREYWFQKESDDAVSLAFARDVESDPNDLIDPSDVGPIPDVICDVLGENGLARRPRADSLQEVLS